jgi:hypothetical protein
MGDLDIAWVVPGGGDLSVWPPRAPRPRDASRPPHLLRIGHLDRVTDQRLPSDLVVQVRRAYADAALDVVGEDALDGAQVERVHAAAVTR